jgi:hypothetical protein
MIKEDRFDQNIIAQIKHRKIFPRPQWLFILKNWGIWLSGALALIFGALSSALLIYFFQGGTLAANRRAGASPAELLLLSVPFFWLFAAMVFVYLAYLNIKNTSRGYRYSPWLIGSATLLASLLIGLALYGLGFSRTIDNVLGRQLPFYEYVVNPRIGFWSNAGRGRLSGVIITKEDVDQRLLLIDRDNQTWQVDISQLRAPAGFSAIDFSKLNGRPVGFWGQRLSNNQFAAKELIPLRGGEGFFGRPGRPSLGPRNGTPPAIR